MFFKSIINLFGSKQQENEIKNEIKNDISRLKQETENYQNLIRLVQLIDRMAVATVNGDREMFGLYERAFKAILIRTELEDLSLKEARQVLKLKITMDDLRKVIYEKE